MLSLLIGGLLLRVNTSPARRCRHTHGGEYESTSHIDVVRSASGVLLLMFLKTCESSFRFVGVAFKHLYMSSEGTFSSMSQVYSILQYPSPGRAG